jgi:hypothetical protein
MAHRSLFLLLPLAIAMSAFANSPTEKTSNVYWTNPKAQSDFGLDDAACVANVTQGNKAATRTETAGSPPSAHNRIDQPPKRWTDPAVERSYMECMRSKGWSVKAR